MVGSITALLVNGGMILAGVITGALLTSRLSLNREYWNQCGQFYAAFNEVLDYLKGGRWDDDTKLVRSAQRHEDAIGVFKFWLDSSRRGHFTEDCKTYRKARHFAQNQEGQHCLTKEQAQELIDAIEKLLSYTEYEGGLGALVKWLV